MTYLYELRTEKNLVLVPRPKLSFLLQLDFHMHDDVEDVAYNLGELAIHGKATFSLS